MNRRNAITSLGSALVVGGMAGCLGYDRTCPDNFTTIETGTKHADDSIIGYADLRYVGNGDGPKVQLKMRFIDDSVVLSNWIYVTDIFPVGETVRVTVQSDRDKHQTATDVEWQINENGYAEECR